MYTIRENGTFLLEVALVNGQVAPTYELARVKLKRSAETSMSSAST
jgi:hypothetical protein